VFKSDDIAYFYVENGISYLVDRKTNYKYITAKALRNIESLLHSGDFFRVNKKYLIHIDAVVKFRPGRRGKLELTISPDPDEPIVISQLKARAFKEWILLA
jgi:DNA-binding LytR/AlgR family response regulator